MTKQLADTPEVRNIRRQKSGVVLSNKMTNTVVVVVTRTLPDPKYGKIVKRQKKYYAHNEKTLNVGDKVTIEETRPISKLKRWRVIEEQAKG